MATEVFVNIKDLPELTTISNGDYIVVENSAGTHIVNFENFIIPPENNALSNTVTDYTNAVVVISSTVVENQNNILSLSADFIANLNAATTDISNSLTDINDRLGVLSAFSHQSTTYIGKTQISINPSSKTGVNVLYPVIVGDVLDVTDIIVTPANLYAARFPAFVEDVSTTSVVRIRGGFTRYDVTGATTVATDIVAQETALYNIIAIKRF